MVSVGVAHEIQAIHLKICFFFEKLGTSFLFSSKNFVILSRKTNRCIVCYDTHCQGISAVQNDSRIPLSSLFETLESFKAGITKRFGVRFFEKNSAKNCFHVKAWCCTFRKIYAKLVSCFCHLPFLNITRQIRRLATTDTFFRSFFW